MFMFPLKNLACKGLSACHGWHAAGMDLILGTIPWLVDEFTYGHLYLLVLEIPLVPMLHGSKTWGPKEPELW